jgi:hypothetical protein
MIEIISKNIINALLVFHYQCIAVLRSKFIIIIKNDV